MLLPIQRFLNIPVMSLQTGSQLARTSQPIIDPRQFKVIAFHVEGPRLTAKDAVLYPEDIREFSEIGMIIDSDDELMSTEGLVRLQEILAFDFELVGIRVEDESGHKLGKVTDYALDPDSYYIQQFYTQPSFPRNVTSTGLTIQRSQIMSVTNERIIVRGNTVKQTKKTVEMMVGDFVNPFRNHPKPVEQSRQVTPGR